MLQELVTYSKFAIFTLFIRPFISEAPLAWVNTLYELCLRVPILAIVKVIMAGWSIVSYTVHVLYNNNLCFSVAYM